MKSPHNIGSTLSEKLANLKVGYFNVLLANASNRLWQITPICFRRAGLRPESAISGFVTLEHFQTQALKHLFGAPTSVPPAIVRLFSGGVPFSGRLDLLKFR